MQLCHFDIVLQECLGCVSRLPALSDVGPQWIAVAFMDLGENKYLLRIKV